MYQGVPRIGFARASLREKEKWPKRPLGSETHKTVKNSVTKPSIKILRPLFILQLLILLEKNPFHTPKCLNGGQKLRIFAIAFLQFAVSLCKEST